ncbi:F-box/kelch-repeat protein At3g23880-like [Lycium barbarum]|uniref:F-box/kelch-repeat protein At3g23880-like n=1 Tax=Lycium barbarum TaxID=112863 RepID=UPI00293EC43C|nr:F-box/kelch-repeat protein At3g23880-like [Lycium barbarum]
MILILPFLTLVPELNTEIFSRLPVSFLLQIRSVSKSWLAFISSPKFIKAHLSISADNKEYTNHRLMLRFYQPKYNLKDCSLRSLLYDSVPEAADLDYPMKKQPKPFWVVVGSVNGLICLSNRAKDLCIWNPSIRKHRKLPDFTTNFRDRFIDGFGYDKLHGDYKVVGCIFDNRSLDKVEVKIYSQKSDSWRGIQNLPNGLKCFGSGKCVNGKLHWANNTSYVLYKG